MTLYARLAMSDLQRYPWQIRSTINKFSLPDQVWIRYQCFCFIKLFFFSFAVSLQKWLAHFLMISSNGETHRNSNQKNYDIFHSFDQIIKSGIAIFALKPWRSLEIMLTVPLNLEIYILRLLLLKLNFWFFLSFYLHV